ncbi:MAG: 3-isopropylmalate dehydratase [bacterium]
MTVWRYGDDVDTDQLFPGKYTYTCSTPEEILPHLLEDLDPEFAEKAAPGDIIVAGSNFGCGSSREQPAVGLKSVGIQAIIAKSFSRIFYRAAVNQGLVLVECPEAVEAYEEGDVVTYDPATGDVEVGGERFETSPLPEILVEIREAGGLLEAVRARLARCRREEGR